VSRNALRHGLSTPPLPDRVQYHASIILDDPCLEPVHVSEVGLALAWSLADAEAQLERVRNSEFTILERISATEHRTERHAPVTSDPELALAYRAMEGLRDPLERNLIATFLRSQETTVPQTDAFEITDVAGKLRRLLRYRREAEVPANLFLAWPIYAIVFVENLISARIYP
jgi:hypothetical protein